MKKDPKTNPPSKPKPKPPVDGNESPVEEESPQVVRFVLASTQGSQASSSYEIPIGGGEVYIARFEMNSSGAMVANVDNERAVEWFRENQEKSSQKGRQAAWKELEDGDEPVVEYREIFLMSEVEMRSWAETQIEDGNNELLISVYNWGRRSMPGRAKPLREALDNAEISITGRGRKK